MFMLTSNVTSVYPSSKPGTRGTTGHIHDYFDVDENRDQVQCRYKPRVLNSYVSSIGTAHDQRTTMEIIELMVYC